METQRGLYLGTEIEDKWWKRYTKDDFGPRGNGRWWYDDKGFYFFRYLTRKPMFVPFDSLLAVRTGRWHAGRWAYGNTVIRLVWLKDSLRLSSGFIVSRRAETTDEVIQVLRGKMPGD